jgi:hypothetical protein
MTVFEYINANIDRVKFGIKIGLISSTFLRHWEIYCRFDYYKKAGNPISEAILNAGDDFKVSETQVYRIKKQMEAII